MVKYPQRHQQSLTFVAFPEIIERIIHNRTLRFGVILLVIIMGFCIEKGCIVHEGMMDGIWSNEEVIKKYLVV